MGFISLENNGDDSFTINGGDFFDVTCKFLRNQSETAVVMGYFLLFFDEPIGIECLHQSLDNFYRQATDPLVRNPPPAVQEFVAEGSKDEEEKYFLIEATQAEIELLLHDIAKKAYKKLRDSRDNRFEWQSNFPDFLYFQLSSIVPSAFQGVAHMGSNDPARDREIQQALAHTITASIKETRDIGLDADPVASASGLFGALRVSKSDRNSKNTGSNSKNNVSKAERIRVLVTARERANSRPFNLESKRDTESLTAFWKRKWEEENLGEVLMPIDEERQQASSSSGPM